jgi:hypothetical protein
MTEWTTQPETITGYVGPQTGGKSGKSRCVHLYTDTLGWHVCTVWEEDFDQLPFGIGDQMMSNPTIFGTAPAREKAKQDEVLQSCPAFDILVYVEPQPDGSIVRKKKLAEVIGPAGVASARESQARGRTAGVPAEDVGNLEFNPVEHVVVYDLARSIATENSRKLRAVLDIVSAELGDFLEAQRGSGKDIDIGEESFRYYAGLVYRDVSKAYEVIRPAYLAQREAGVSSEWFKDSVIDTIEYGKPETFLVDVANAHPLLVDEDHARILLKEVGATGVPKDAVGRLNLAEKVWLYVELVSRFNFSKTVAKQMVGII